VLRLSIATTGVYGVKELDRSGVALLQWGSETRHVDKSPMVFIPTTRTSSCTCDGCDVILCDLYLRVCTSPTSVPFQTTISRRKQLHSYRSPLHSTFLLARSLGKHNYSRTARYTSAAVAEGPPFAPGMWVNRHSAPLAWSCEQWRGYARGSGPTRVLGHRVRMERCCWVDCVGRRSAQLVGSALRPS
jgi:hypothetical protein